jgi:hypothetical protein
VSVLLAIALAAAQEQAPAEPAAPLRVLSPWGEEDLARLDAWSREQAGRIGVTFDPRRIVELTLRDLAPETLLLGYERGLLDGLDGEGLLAAAPERGAAVVTFAFESWTPAWIVDPEAELADLDSFAAFARPAWRGRVCVRRVGFDSTEGLILGDLARRLDWLAEEDLMRLVLSSDEGGTIRSATASGATLLRDLPLGAATLVPVRDAVFARRAGRRASFPLPTEGFLSVELGAALTEDSSPSRVAWLHESFAPAIAPLLCRALEFEPAGPLPDDAPEWMRIVLGHRREIERESAAVVRVRLARLYAAAPSRQSLPSEGLLARFVDVLLILGGLAFGFVVWRLGGRRDPDRRSVV